MNNLPCCSSLLYPAKAEAIQPGMIFSKILTAAEAKFRYLGADPVRIGPITHPIHSTRAEVYSCLSR